MTTITAHGKTYSSISDARARVAHLEAENDRLGASDGRVTEIVLLTEAIESAATTEPARPRRSTPNPRPFVVLYRRGDGYKGRRTFKTEGAQLRFIINAPSNIAITGF